ncbi:S9 family peptidase [Candidatus Kaiserbacteria bacterium]|nr:S9 family peptidase [Candidatus Kaiserbacteria bacterium]
MTSNHPQPPVAERRQHLVPLHGITRFDPYAWLRADNWREVFEDPSVLDPSIRTHLDAENEYVGAIMAPTQTLQDTLYAEMIGRIEQEKTKPPVPHGPWLYYSRTEKGKDYQVYCRRRKDDPLAVEEVLLDCNREAEGQKHFSLGTCSHSSDHRFFAYTVDLNGSELYTLSIKDIATGELLAERIARVNGESQIVWSADNTAVFYVREDDDHRPVRTYRHVLGTSGAEDILVYEEKDEECIVSIHATQDDRFLCIDSGNHETTVAYFFAIDGSDQIPHAAAPRSEGVLQGTLEHNDGILFLLTNAGGAGEFQIMTRKLRSSGDWHVFIPHRPGVFIQNMFVLKRHLVRLETEHALPRIVVRELATDAEHMIAFDEEMYEVRVVPGLEFDTPVLRFVYESPTIPPRTYDYDMDTHKRVLVDETIIPSGHDPDKYVARQIMAPSHDGVEVPVTLLYRKDLSFDMPPPCFLYGYGSYGFSLPAEFASSRLSLADCGFVIAVARVRGGADCGFGWYTSAKRMKKMNTFLDFIAAAEELVRKGFAAPRRIAICGGSAGGLLVGAVLNMRPDLWGAAVAQVPFVDVITTMCDTSLPLTPQEWPEWGNPIDDKDAYDYMLSYSPYDNVSARPYPPTLTTAGLTDPRVTYWEPAKWVAKLRHANPDGLFLLRTEMEHGHGGATGRFTRMKEWALTYAFVIEALSGRLTQ